MNTENKSTEVDNTDKKLHISDVRNSIQERIKRHKDYLSICYDIVQNESRPIDVISTLIDEIKRTQIRISELEGVLEYCF